MIKNLVRDNKVFERGVTDQFNSAMNKVSERVESFEVPSLKAKLPVSQIYNKSTNTNIRIIEDKSASFDKERIIQLTLVSSSEISIESNVALVQIQQDIGNIFGRCAWLDDNDQWKISPAYCTNMQIFVRFPNNKILANTEYFITFDATSA